MYLAAAPVRSLPSTPTKTTFDPDFAAASWSVFASSLQSTHQDAQKLTTTTLPRYAARSKVPPRPKYGRRVVGADTIWPLSTFAATPWLPECETSQTSSASSASTTAA